VVESNAHHHRHIRIDHVHGIQAASHTDLEHPCVEVGRIEHEQCRERVELEEGQPYFTACGLDSLERRHQFRGADQAIVDPDPFTIVAQMRRGERTDPQPRGRHDRRAICAHRTLAVGSGHGYHGIPGLLPPEAIEHKQQPIQPKIDGLRVHLRLVGQPLLETQTGSYAAAGSLPVNKRSIAPIRSRSSRRSTIISSAPCSSKNSLR
jgi:hypothetical protein